MNLQDIKAELEKQEKYQELKKHGVTFEDFSVVKDGKYIQVAKSGYNTYYIVIGDENIIFEFDDNCGM